MADAANTNNPPGEEVKPYRIHIPTRHLELTKHKLEFTRLPHEAPAGLWEPKPEVETLIDFWTEKYSWRDQESVLNTSFPQFRTSIALPSHGITTPLRIHFIHVRSPRADALPLLLLPPFPFTNLSFGHLVAPLTEPHDAAEAQAFHVVIPSLPGLGFSDALPASSSSGNPIPASAALFDALMARLEYLRYVATTTSPGHQSPARVDYRLVRRLATHHAASCVGAHFISPPLEMPDLRRAPWEWTKWNVARFFRAGVLGYDEGDFAALERPRWVASSGDVERKGGEGIGAGLNGFGSLREPNALAYALCDSPVGMLVFVLRALWLLGRKGDVGKGSFPEERIITSTMLAWLPGFEHALRFWAGAANQGDEEGVGERAKLVVTVFMGGSASRDNDSYACPAWANAEFDVVGVQRLTGKNESKGLLAFERPEVVVDGARALAKGLLSRDAGAFLAKGKGVAIVPLEKVVVVPDNAPDTTLLSPERGKGVAGPGVLATPAVTPRDEKDEQTTPKDAKGKGKEALPPPTPIPVRDPLLDGESPDTLVEGAKTPPLEKVGKRAPNG
ncbi:epoxide hydrolase [Podospora aff. communis PSN243]|uniref:Epoxide hydrolase n=1 Tax=Podospora aff. communis PSN243 TaxID=3040156 RepID=A0AAV9GXU1_9PEZI|nr:epoxide hydrolase [Podospora aff. communis PSN243]